MITPMNKWVVTKKQTTLNPHALQTRDSGGINFKIMSEFTANWNERAPKGNGLNVYEYGG